MIKIENECCGCAVPGYPCLGESCERRRVKRVYCDICGEELPEWYEYGSKELCEYCILSVLETDGVIQKCDE